MKVELLLIVVILLSIVNVYAIDNKHQQFNDIIESSGSIG